VTDASVPLARLAEMERLMVRSVFSAPGPTFPFGAHLAVVEVDTETGEGGRAPGGGRVALANMGAVPVRARAAEEALAGGASPAEAAELAADGTEPGEDIHSDRAFRQHLARVLTRRALEHRAD